MTLKDMRDELADNCLLAEVSAPSSTRAAQLLNRAKDEVVARLELVDQNIFTDRQSYTVAAEDASIALPSNFRRLVGLTRTDKDYDVEVTLINIRERERYVGWADSEIPRHGYATDSVGTRPVMYREGSNLYFVNRDGAPQSMTLLMRYRKRVADLAESDVNTATTTYDDIPADWHEVIVLLATLQALPRANAEYPKHQERMVSLTRLLRIAYARTIADKPIRIKMVR